MDMLSDLLNIIAAGGIDISNLPQTKADGDTLKTILNIFLAISGAIAVLVVVLSGVRFITSKGSPAEISKARNGIIYAAIGLVVIMSAFSIVNFVIFRVT